MERCSKDRNQNKQQAIIFSLPINTATNIDYTSLEKQLLQGNYHQLFCKKNIIDYTRILGVMYQTMMKFDQFAFHHSQLTLTKDLTPDKAVCYLLEVFESVLLDIDDKQDYKLTIDKLFDIKIEFAISYYKTEFGDVSPCEFLSVLRKNNKKLYKIMCHCLYHVFITMKCQDWNYWVERCESEYEMFSSDIDSYDEPEKTELAEEYKAFFTKYKKKEPKIISKEIDNSKCTLDELQLMIDSYQPKSSIEKNMLYWVSETIKMSRHGSIYQAVNLEGEDDDHERYGHETILEHVTSFAWSFDDKVFTRCYDSQIEALNNDSYFDDIYQAVTLTSYGPPVVTQCDLYPRLLFNWSQMTYNLFCHINNNHDINFL